MGLSMSESFEFDPQAGTITFPNDPTAETVPVRGMDEAEFTHELIRMAVESAAACTHRNLRVCIAMKGATAHDLPDGSASRGEFDSVMSIMCADCHSLLGAESLELSYMRV
jgi:hypothetical protein